MGERGKVCATCGVELEEFQRHRHCSGCGTLLGGFREKHAPTCPRLGLSTSQFCGTCGRLLAAGAWCPEHGAPPSQGELL